MSSVARISLVLIAASAPYAANSQTQQSPFLEQIGFQGSTDNEDGINIKGAEVYGILGTDWDWDLSQALQMELKFKTSLGIWDSDDETTALIHFAPQLRMHYKDFPVYLSGSLGPTLISEDEPEEDHDMGGILQFTSSIGIHCELTERLEIGYDYQHTSNASIYSDNDGLNMHTFSAAYTF